VTARWGLRLPLSSSLHCSLIPPYFTLQVLQPQGVVDLIVLLVVAVVISQLLGRANATGRGPEGARGHAGAGEMPLEWGRVLRVAGCGSSASPRNLAKKLRGLG
jgi:hypothetical protein